MSIGISLSPVRQHKDMPKTKRRDPDAAGFAERLVALLAEHDQPRRGAGAYLSRRYKVSTVTANDWLKGSFRPNTDTVRRIAEDHGTTFEALYFGTAPRSATLARYRVAESNGDDDALPVELWSARGSCGGGAINWEEDQREPLLKEPSWFRRYKVRPQDAVAVWADGDSMADFIVDGDIVIFDRSKTTPKSGKIFLIEHPDGLRIKRLRRDIEGTWILESNNPDKRRYPDERIGPDQADLLTVRGEFVYRQGG